MAAQNRPKFQLGHEAQSLGIAKFKARRRTGVEEELAFEVMMRLYLEWYRQDSRTRKRHMRISTHTHAQTSTHMAPVIAGYPPYLSGRRHPQRTRACYRRASAEGQAPRMSSWSR
jgi:hypothetical protein